MGAWSQGSAPALRRGTVVVDFCELSSEITAEVMINYPFRG